MMDHGHDSALVLLSIAVSAFASFTALSLAERLRQSAGAARRLWLAAAAVAMGGGGIWSMHFIAMLAWNPGIPVSYRPGLTALSMLVAIVFTGIGFSIVSRRGRRPMPLLAAGVFMGGGVGAMHYTGMAAVQIDAVIAYDFFLYHLSFAIAIVVSMAALWLSFARISLGFRIFTSLIMAAAVSGMHYTGMAGVRLHHAEPASASMAGGLPPVILAIAVGVTTMFVLFLALILAIVDRRFAAHAKAEEARLRAEVEERTRELVAMKDAAEEASLAKSQFLANMSHELRTPLNAIIGYTEMLLEDATANGRGHDADDLKRVRGASRHLLALINDVLDLSKIEAGKMEIHNQRIELRHWIDEVVGTCDRLVSKNGNDFVIDCPAEIGAVILDPTKLRQALFNLIGNAAKFTEEGTVKLEVRRARGWVTFAVRDTGIGIGADQIDRLFENFTQADAGTAARYGGTGLGLSLSQKLCRLMGGRIEVDSTEGVGSTFTIHLPDGSAPAADRAPVGQAMPALLPASV